MSYSCFSTPSTAFPANVSAAFLRSVLAELLVKASTNFLTESLPTFLRLSAKLDNTPELALPIDSTAASILSKLSTAEVTLLLLGILVQKSAISDANAGRSSPKPPRFLVAPLRSALAKLASAFIAETTA